MKSKFLNARQCQAMTHTQSCFIQLHLGILLLSIGMHGSFKLSVTVSNRWECHHGEGVSGGRAEFKCVPEHLLTLKTVWSVFELDVVELQL